MDFKTSLDNYNIFYEVAKCENLTKASEKLFISQPAVSQSLKKLEDNLGVVLFVRSKHGMKLTPIGKKIFEFVEPALKKLSSIEELIDSEKGLISGEIVISSGSNIARKILFTPMAKFMKDYQNVKLKLTEGLQAETIKKLESGEFQLVITQQNNEITFPFIPLHKTKYCFVKNKNSSAQKFIMITEGSFAHSLFENFIKNKNLENIQTMQVAGYKSALELTALGLGITLIPEYILDEIPNASILTKVFTDYELPSITFGAYYNNNLMTPATKTFLKYIKEQ